MTAKSQVIKRTVMLVLLLAISGALIFGGVHRTQAVLAKETGGLESVQTHESEEFYDAQSENEAQTESGPGTGSGEGGLRDGSGRGSRGVSEGYTE